MCDSLCAMPSCSKEESAIFAKNSDRSPNEPHLVIRSEGLSYLPGNTVKLTYITIPQATHTFETILCKPSWTWGAEMGVNEKSVAIGNEAVFTRAKRGREALTGMDLVRLALERAESARIAIDIITSLLEEFGQGGNCGFDHKFYYDNSFLIVDPHEGYVLETAGKRWVAEPVKDRHAISNRLSIHIGHTLRGGVEENYDFAGRLTEPLYTHFSGSRQRRVSAMDSLDGTIDAGQMMCALRTHHPKDEDSVFTKGSMRSVCMHAGGIVGDHTTGSLVAVLRENAPATLWVTGASTPCIAAFKPVFFGPDCVEPVFAQQSSAQAYWLARETLHRAVLAGAVNVAALRGQRDALEAQWLEKERALFASGIPSPSALADLSQEAAAQERKMIAAFTPKQAWSMPAKGRFYTYWAKKTAVLEKPETDKAPDPVL